MSKKLRRTVRRSAKSENQAVAATGFSATTVADFLGLTPEEEALIEQRLSRLRTVRERDQKPK